MDSKVKNEVEAHILKASGLGEKSRGYKAIQRLFSKEELIIWFEYELLMDIRRGCHKLGLEIKLKRELICIDEEVVRNYYEKVMGMKYPDPKPEISYYERFNLNKKD
ncbi:hypothetical protein [Flavobacterium sp. F52]|uniref:hypothetical protein n=1 Tax=Flavobacterium sp. F52 TaxID=1202532 RepID=UPI000272DFC9|nr:hypothetical protein [Flavobacterium sp. F52]EJG02273.1 hypothetical protein FF52_06320 [Flavobacterium sp. F52]